MGRGRWDSNREADREDIEGDLAALGNARVYIHLVMERVSNLATRHNAGELLSPAISDLAKVDRIVIGVQGRIKSRYEDTQRRPA